MQENSHWQTQTIEENHHIDFLKKDKRQEVWYLKVTAEYCPPIRVGEH